MKFDEYSISEGIKKSIAKQGFKKPTDIQYKSIPPILRGEDVLAIAQTGTGKTAAFVIPILHLLQVKKTVRKSAGIKCLVMAPTHELALQINEVFVSLSKHTKVNSFCIHGGVEQDRQKEELGKGVDVLIATPGRLFDLVSQGDVVLKGLEILVLDEADHMLDLGFIKDIKDLMRHLPERRQTLFFSATINEKIKKLAYSLVVNPIRIQISPKDPVAKNIEHAVASIEMDDKRFFLGNMLAEHPDRKTLVFVRTKVRAERLKLALERQKIEAITIHGDKDQKERESSMQAFRKGEQKTLIATDISARGIDIPNVEFVVNYDLPESAEQYVHRVGRTGRGREKGQALSFCATEEVALLEEIDQNLGKPIARLEISKKNYQMTKASVTENNNEEDWKSLMEHAAIETEAWEKKKKKRKKNKK
ncbi:MAG: DEAD/DEAH box helicase [Flavobacteriales bacterium]|nr:DEAD/DEAH box helicase [Flavobacteriales bacterium]